MGVCVCVQVWVLVCTCVVAAIPLPASTLPAVRTGEATVIRLHPSLPQVKELLKPDVAADITVAAQRIGTE